MTYYFQAKQLCVGYQNQPLIQNIEIELKKGEILTLIGPNGAGKSTILKSIARQLELLGGSVLLEDKNLQSLSGRELAKKMAVVFTKRPHTELMTCEDVVATGRYPYTGRFGVLSAKDHEAVQEAMEAVHVLEFRDRDFAKISDGQRQRVMLARAICQEPKILILDEPTVGLDPRQIREFRDLLSELSHEHTIILSSHILSEISSVCKRILVFYEGMLIADGEPQSLQEQLAGHRVLEVEISGEEAGVSALLQGIPDVLAVKPVGNGVYQVAHRMGTDIRGALYRTLRPTGYELLMMKPEEVSLESLYLRITEHEQEMEA
mgnify:CR=1 FL=1